MKHLFIKYQMTFKTSSISRRPREKSLFTFNEELHSSSMAIPDLIVEEIWNILKQ